MDVFSAAAFLFMPKVSPAASAQGSAVEVGGLHFLTATLQAGNTAVCRTVWPSHTKVFKSALCTTELLGQAEVRPGTKISPVSLSLVCHCCSGEKLGLRIAPTARLLQSGWLGMEKVTQVPLQERQRGCYSPLVLLHSPSCQHPAPGTFKGTGFSQKLFIGGDEGPFKA